MNEPRSPIDKSAALSKVTEALQALQRLIVLLNDDIGHFSAAPDGAGKRAFVRAVFAYVEGTSYAFRQFSLQLAHMRGVDLTLGETLLANEVGYSLNEKGQVEQRLALAPPLANLRFSLALFAKATKVAYEFPAGDARFADLQQAQRVRNRLMHPRSPDELEIADAERELVLRAWEWLSTEQCGLIASFAHFVLSAFDRFFEGAEAVRKEDGSYSPEELLHLLNQQIQGPPAISPKEAAEWFDQFRRRLGAPQDERSSDVNE